MIKDLLGTAAPAFDDPLEMLYACHDRICAQSDTLDRLVAHLLVQGNDEQSAQAARAILRYFDTAGQHHHQDEEQDLFPMLIASGNAEAAEYVARLLAEHKILDAAWRDLRPQLIDIEQGMADAIDADIAAHFIAGYARHIKFENETMLPLAATLLNEAQVQQLGQNMAARRGVTL
ncbi:MAG: hemerythrin domain-containing protein [Gammaproteobacteria bacterium]|nr:hemerythrin domain-containing protein [Gammaproteobacteria bacterium]MBU1625657.1 hemerythrin domain-containing protein [Gammaproteobacteria bacterium]MBU1980917.1 hemerythrin domain-containing protein [Gammaproteobacteria bacterium]